MSHYIDAPWRHDPPIGFSIYKPHEDEARAHQNCLAYITRSDSEVYPIQLSLWNLVDGRIVNRGTRYKLPLTWVGNIVPIDETGLVLAAKLRILHGIDMRGFV